MCLTSIGIYLIVCTWGAFSGTRIIEMISRESFAIYLIHEFIICIIVMHCDLSHLDPYVSSLLLFVAAFFVRLLFHNYIIKQVLLYVKNYEKDIDLYIHIPI